MFITHISIRNSIYDTDCIEWYFSQNFMHWDISLRCLDVPALMNRDKHPICSRQGHLYHVGLLTPPLIQQEHEYNVILGVTVRFLVVSFKS